ncbi:hypothetical protein QBC40DRAFT_171071 [Triangularia verruculosa]|uniref:Zn(2)-C6 fungal-type domain-containing protein n=1 Tax=Triangularia verruculosa TaxID=2587418 RepID=A0AAN7AX15_9PEZI|nr:hypothetical protein QBC40DRAFT_171071 [Triangularia verruculosa]
MPSSLDNLEPWGHPSFYCVPPISNPSDLARCSLTINSQVRSRTGWHLNTLIPTSPPNAEGLHKPTRRPHPGTLQRSRGRGSVISQPYNQPSSLANAEIDGRVAVDKFLIQHNIPVMSDPTQNPVPPRPSRAERTTTSCGECRRRKQRCNQGQPCNNCARRYPQPVCEYRPNSRRSSAVAAAAAAAAASGQPSPFSISILPPPLSPGHFGIEGIRPSLIPPRQRSPLAPSWPRTPGQEATDALAGWPGFDTLSHASMPPSNWQYAWSTDRSFLHSHFSVCEESCTQHSAAVHDAVRTLRAYHPGGPGLHPWGGGWWNAENSAWATGHDTSPGMSPGISPGGGNVTWGVPTPASISPAPPVLQDGDLFTVYIKLISQFKASLDGNPDSSNPYIKYYIPYCIQSPLLQHVGVYTAACFLADSGHVERTAAMKHKGEVIELVNKHLSSQLSTSDESITGVIQLVLNEWHWGNDVDLRAHLTGLREMIRVRGGFRTLGLHGLISKLAITADIAIALSSEAAPFLQGGTEFEFRDNSQVPLRLPLNTPFISKLATFASCDEALRIHGAVASMLDDMRFLLAAVLALPENPTQKELQKVHTTSGWIHERMMNLPAEGPTLRRLSFAAGSPAPSSAASATSAKLSPLDSRPSPELGDDQRLTTAGGTRGRPRSLKQQHPRQTLGDEHAAVSRLEGSQSPAPAAGSSMPSDPPDYTYQSVRLAAILYSRAIMLRRPFREVVTQAEYLQLWKTMWKVPLSTWRHLLGVFNWILLPLVSSTGSGDGDVNNHGHFVKGMLNVSLLQIGMENWELCRGVMEASVGLQRWLSGGGAGDDGGEGKGDGPGGMEGGRAQSEGSERGSEKKDKGKQVVG